MECPYCDSGLIDEGEYGFIARHQSGEVLGRIYRCPNHEGFIDEQEAVDYLFRSDTTMSELGITDPNDICCDSCAHHVSGSFYTDKNGNLHNGYPC